MLRAFLIALSRAEWARKIITSWGFARRASRRFIAGESAAEALEVVRELNRRGIHASLDHLGENTTSVQEARAAAAEVLALLEAIQRAGLRANVSLKLSQLGLELDPELCRTLLEGILSRARELDNFVRIDMEGSALTERTLAVYNAALAAGFAGHTGIVLQAYLYRSAADLEQLLAAGGSVRLCKGAYQEPPALAYPRKRDVDQNYDRLALTLLRAALRFARPAGGRIPPPAAFATHDEARVEFVRRTAAGLGLKKAALEFQMLYGIRRDLQERLAAQGYPVRVYVPYGARWYPFFMRRLAERPANLFFFLSNLLRK